MGSGIDYGMGLTNIDTNNGIRYGVISCNSLSEWFWESVVHHYGDPHCPKCGNEAKEGDGEETRWITTDEVSSFVDGSLGKELERTTLYWSNEDGWVEDEDSATIFTNEEKETFNLPMGEGYKVEWTVKEFSPYRERGCCGDYHCPSCLIYFDGDDAYPDEPLGWTIEENGGNGIHHDGEELPEPTLRAENCLDNDCIITKSPYYTYAPFCSPCVPGAGNLDSMEIDDFVWVENDHEPDHLEAQRGVRTYCFDKSWFSEDHPCPYPYWSVETNELVYLPQRKEETLNDEVVGDSSKVLVEEPPAEIIEEVTRAYRGENGIEIGGEG